MKRAAFLEELKRWHDIALESHQRPAGGGNIYASSQSVVENVAHRQLAKLSQSKRSVLEIGVGGGEHLTYEMSNPARDTYIASELDADFAAQAQSTFNCTIVRADARELPFSDGQFDAVIAASVLEHIPDLGTVAAELSRVLKNDGELLALVPTNGSFALSLFKTVMTYPFLSIRGLRSPQLIWHYENANHLLRIEALLTAEFAVCERINSPVSWLPWQLSPMALFRCHKNDPGA